jgi:hypothetical protein
MACGRVVAVEVEDGLWFIDIIATIATSASRPPPIMSIILFLLFVEDILVPVDSMPHLLAYGIYIT